jgi:hypothetical protein
VLEIYNDLGPEKRFWELGWPGAFFQGHPQCGLYLEVAPRAHYADGAAFAATVRESALVDRADPPFTYAGERQRLWHVAYERDGKRLGLEVDLMAWALKRRWTQDGDLGWPMLASPIARETCTGHLDLNSATLACGPEAAWLYTCPETGRYIAAYHGREPAPLRLAVPDGAVEVAAMSTGTIVWDNGEVTVEAVDLQGIPKVTGGRLRR